MKGLKLVTTAALVLLPAAVALASGDGGGDHGAVWKDFIFRVVNFIIFAAILYKFAGKKIAAIFGDRRKQIETQLDELSARREEAERKLKEVESSIANLEQERETILSEFRAQGETLKESIIAKAHEGAEKIKTQAEVSAAQERKQTEQEIRAEVADMVIEAAEKILTEKLGQDEHEKLVDQYIAKVVLN